MSATHRWGYVSAVFLGIVVLLVGAPTASAHTDFDSSTPAQGDVIAEAVSSVVVVFTADTQPVDDLLVALDASGSLQAPSSVTTEDQRTFTVTFEPPLAGGDIGIRWAVLGADGHRLEGSFSFSVTAPVATAALPDSTGADPDDGLPDDALADPTTRDPIDESAADGVVDATAAVQRDAEAQSLDTFLTTETEVPGDGRRLAGRLVSIPAIAAAVGALAFLVFAMRGSAREITAVVSGIRIAGVVVAVGALIQYSGIVAATGGSAVTEWTDTPSRAMVLRLLGSIVVVFGLRAVTMNRSGAFAPRSRSLSAAVIDDSTSDVTDTSRSRRSNHRERWDAASSKPALAGAALLVASFWFDGHTVTDGWRPLHAIVNSVHVVAGSVWFGGVVTLAALAWWRHRRGDDVRVGELVVRFSSVATVALVVVAVAGLVLAVIVLDGFGDVTGTEWGRTLMLKTAAVALAASLGAYNHFALRPALAVAPDDAAVRATLRSVLTAEAILLVFVVVVTCWLVAAAT